MEMSSSDQAFNNIFHERLESIQYNTATTGAIRGTSKKKLYQELGVVSLQSSRKFISFLQNNKK